MKKVLITATVQSHIAQFHKPLIRLLHEMGCQVEAAAKNNLHEKNNLTLTEPDKIHEVDFCRNPFSLRIFPAYRQLKKVIKAGDYDVVHCNTPVAGILTRLACRKLRRQGKVKVFYTAHGFHFYQGAPRENWILWYPIEKLFARMTDVLITITDEDYRLASEKFACKVVRHHGVGANSKKFYIMDGEEKAKIRQELGIPADTKVLVNIGELLPNKNQKILVEVMKLLRKQYPDTLLLIAGDGPEKNNLLRLIEENGLSEHIRLLGYTTDVHKLLNICDVMVACSIREGLPISVMEAMLCGKPVVASMNRGHRELVEENVTGYLVSSQSPAQFAERIREIFSSGRDYSAEALRKVQPFTDECVTKEMRELYGNI